MSQRALTLIVLLVFVTELASGQAKKYTPPRTPDGQPDLQGFWTNSTYTPLERPRNVNKEFYTKEEALEAEKKAAAQETEQTVPGTIADVHYDFTQFGLDRSQSTHSLNLRTSLIVDPPDGRLPPLTPEGQKRLDATEFRQTALTPQRPPASWEDYDLYIRCISRGLAGSMLSSSYDNGTQIIQAPGFVTLVHEKLHEARVIPLGQQPHIGKDIRTYLGDSRGHWEGDALVIETTN